MKQFLVHITVCLVVLFAGTNYVDAQLYRTSNAKVQVIGTSANAGGGYQTAMGASHSNRASSSSESGMPSVSIGISTAPRSLSTLTTDAAAEVATPASYQMASTSSASMSPARYATAGLTSSPGVFRTIASFIVPGTTTEDYSAGYAPASAQARQLSIGGWAPPVIAPINETWDVLLLIGLCLVGLVLYRKKIMNKNSVN